MSLQNCNTLCYIFGGEIEDFTSLIIVQWLRWLTNNNSLHSLFCILWNSFQYFNSWGFITYYVAFSYLYNPTLNSSPNKNACLPHLPSNCNSDLNVYLRSHYRDSYNSRTRAPSLFRSLIYAALGKHFYFPVSEFGVVSLWRVVSLFSESEPYNAEREVGIKSLEHKDALWSTCQGKATITPLKRVHYQLPTNNVGDSSNFQMYLQ